MTIFIIYIFYCSFHNQSLLQASSFKIGQKLDLIIEVVEQHAGTKLVIGDCFIVDLVCFGALLECYRLVDRVHNCLDDIAFSELKGLYAVVMLSLGVAPTSSVCTDHVRSMSDRAEVKTVVLTYNHLRVTHANSNPI